MHMKRILSGIVLALLAVSMLGSTFTVGTSKPERTGVNDKTQKPNPYSQTLSEPPPTEWTKTYGGASDDWAYALVQTSDGGYAVAGSTNSSGAGGYDFWLVKTDAGGNMQWNRNYGGTGVEIAYSVVQTSDGGYALAGITYSFTAGSWDFWLVKTDASGNMQWSKTYGGTGHDYAYSLVQTGDGGYAIAGYTNSFGAGGYDFWLVKTDASGNMQWSKTYGGPGVEIAYSVVQTSDGGYALAGYTNSFGAGSYDFWFVKVAGASYSIVIYKVQPAASVVFQGTVEINIGVTNEGTETETFDLTIKEQMLLSTSPPIPLPYENFLGTLHVSSLPPGSSKEYSFTWNTKGFRPGAYIINAYTSIGNGKFIGGGPIYLQDIGYVILVAGQATNQMMINNYCDSVYETLMSVGFSEDRVCYIKPTYPILGEASAFDNLKDAIEEWAASRVNKVEPLFLYMFGHGGGDPYTEHGFIIDSGPLTIDVVHDSDLSSWLSNLKSRTGAELYVIFNFCYSGTFMSDLSPIATVTICSCGEQELGYFKYGLDFFGSPFWYAIGEGKSMGQAFNIAAENVMHLNAIFGTQEAVLGQVPLLDDNKDGVGHTGPVPNGGDGAYALSAHIGHCQWGFPWVSSSIATQYSAWPPTGNITLWAKVENDSSLTHVEAGMIPPDCVPTNDSGFVDFVSGDFDMADQVGLGNFTVSIPAVNFTNHASGPSNFTFVIFAEQEDNKTACPCFVNVIFTETGQPPSDTMAPVIHVTRPLDGSIVHGTIQVNGTTSDDVCLSKCELYVDDNLAQTISLPQASSSYFDFSLDTDFLSNGNHTIMTESYDTSNNNANESVSIYVVNDIHDIAIADVGSGKPVVFEGLNLSLTTAVVNHGSYAESTNITVYANSKAIGAAVFSNVTIDGLEILTFTWDTTGFALGNYTISAYAWPVMGETDTANNNFTDGWVMVTRVGDLCGTGNAWDFVPDGVVDGSDLSIVAKCYGSWPGAQPPMIWNANCDVNNDGVVDGSDLAIVARHFGESDP